MIELKCYWCNETFYQWYCDDCSSIINDICEACHKEADSD